MEALVKGAESVFTTKTVVGEATKIDDTIIIPLVDVSFGIGAGASCGAGKDSRKNGGMGGMSGKMSPSAVLLIKNRKHWKTLLHGLYQPRESHLPRHA